MKVCLLAALSFLVASYSAAQLPYTEKRVINYAKSIEVKTLDSSLPSQRLEDWLQFGQPHAHILFWEMNTCDLKPDSIEDYPFVLRLGLAVTVRLDSSSFRSERSTKESSVLQAFIEASASRRHGKL
jgi:hypothetical protein